MTAQSPADLAATVRLQMIPPPGIWIEGTDPGNRALDALVARAEQAERERDERLALEESRTLAFKVTDAEARVAELEQMVDRILHDGWPERIG